MDEDGTCRFCVQALEQRVQFINGADGRTIIVLPADLVRFHLIESPNGVLDANLSLSTFGHSKVGLLSCVLI